MESFPLKFTINQVIVIFPFSSLLSLHVLWGRAVEIPCPACPTWSHFIQDKLKISIYLSLDKCKICYKVNKILYFIFKLIIMSSHVALKTVWILISWLLKKPADLDLHCLQESICMVSYCFRKCKLFKHRKE